jgi:hypothetical protein
MSVCLDRCHFLRRPTALLASIVFLAALATAAPSFADVLAGAAFDSAVLRLKDDTGISLAGGIPSFSGGLFLTSGVTVGPDGNIYVSSRGTGDVLRYDGQTGASLGLFAELPDNPPTEPGGEPTQAAPGPLRFGPDGNLYVSDFGGSNVRKFNGADGTFLGDAATGFFPPGGLAFGSDGDLYVGDFSLGTVSRIHNGTPEPFVAAHAGGLLTPSSLLFLATGELLVVDLYGNQILKYAADGSSLGQFALIPPPIPDPLPPGANFPSNNPSDIAYDADGNLLVAVLGLTNPPDNRGAVLRYNLLGGDPIQTLVNMQTQIGSIAWIANPNAVIGDYNGNLTVGPEDYVKWKDDYGKWVAKGGGADGNGDGIVNAADYTVWRNALGGPNEGGGSALNNVPEPSAVLLVCVTAIAWMSSGNAGRSLPRRRRQDAV